MGDEDGRRRVRQHVLTDSSPQRPATSCTVIIITVVVNVVVHVQHVDTVQRLAQRRGDWLAAARRAFLTIV